MITNEQRAKVVEVRLKLSKRPGVCYIMCDFSDGKKNLPLGKFNMKLYGKRLNLKSFIGKSWPDVKSVIAKIQSVCAENVKKSREDYWRK